MTKLDPIALPALRGKFGDWIYYACLFSVSDIVTRVNFAEEVHHSEELSRLIQRRLKGERARQISQYLRNNDERFFNSLVLATYRGSPDWYDVRNLHSAQNQDVLENLSEPAAHALGLLLLSGKERIFALDGQHRLAGMRKALEADEALGEELLPIVLVAHGTSKTAERRTRRLFTTLNKMAVPVNKLDIISLDEDDVMAIATRRLVEDDGRFRSPKIAIISSESMPPTNKEALLTIAGLYDQLKLLFVYKARVDKGWALSDLRFNRPSDEVLDKFEQFASDYFSALADTFGPIKRYFESAKPSDVVGEFRFRKRNALFFTIGLEIFTRAAITLAKRDDISVIEAVRKLKNFPVDLSKAPYRGVIWDPIRKVVVVSRKSLARLLVFHMLGLPISARQERNLLGDYREALGRVRTDRSITLPEALS